MERACDVGWDPEYLGPPDSRDWMLDPGNGDPCAAADWWREEEARRERIYEDLKKEYDKAVKELEDCKNCRT